MKMKSIAALAVSGFLTLAVSAPLFAESDNSMDNGHSAGQMGAGMNDNGQKADSSAAAPSSDANATDSNKSSGDEGNQQDTATGDDDY